MSDEEERNEQENHEIVLWERLNGEPPEAYARFCTFRDMGKNRNLAEAYLRFDGDINADSGKNGIELTASQKAYMDRKMQLAVPKALQRASWAQWRKWATEWNWWKRALAWDREQERRELEIWAAARKELRENEWKIAGKLLSRADEMLKWPLSEEKTTKPVVTEAELVDERGETVLDESGNAKKVRVRVATTYIVKPAKWSMDTITKMADTASKIARLALDLNTQSVRVENWRDEARMQGVNPEDFVERIAREFLNTLLGKKEEIVVDGEAHVVSEDVVSEERDE